MEQQALGPLEITGAVIGSVVLSLAALVWIFIYILALMRYLGADDRDQKASPLAAAAAAIGLFGAFTGPLALLATPLSLLLAAVDLSRVKSGKSSPRSGLVSRHIVPANLILLGAIAVAIVSFLPMMI